MTLPSLITFITRQHPDWSRMAIMDFIEDVQEIIFSVPVEYMRVLDEKYGTNYQLETTAGTLAYTLDAVVDPHGDTGGAVATIGVDSGTLIDGNFTGVTQSSTTGSGTGFTADIVTAGAVATITITSGGVGHEIADVITIDGATLGGVTVTNDLTFPVATISNAAAYSYPAIMVVGKVVDATGAYEIYNNTMENGNPVARARQGDKENAATIQFLTDPGTTTIEGAVGSPGCKYYVQAYRQPTSIVAETSTLDLPATYHFDLAEGVSALIVKLSNGDASAWENWKGATLPRIRFGLNNEGQGAVYVPSRGK